MVHQQLFIITPTGLSADVRRSCEVAVTALNGTWSGALVLGGPPFRRTTHLLVGGTWVDSLNAKVQAALQAGLPVVTEAWLEHSAEQGFFLDYRRYLAPLAPPQLLCLTAASTTATATAAAAKEEVELQPSDPVSPPERLREARTLVAVAPPFVVLSPCKEQPVELELEAAVVTAALERDESDAAPASPPSRPSPAALSPLFASLRVVSSGGDGLEPETDDPGAAAAATAAATPPSASGSTTTSSAKVIRFMSRAPQVTTVRGGALRRCSSTPTHSSCEWGSHAAAERAHSSPAGSKAPQLNSEEPEPSLGAEPRRLRYSIAARRLLPETAIELGPALPPHRRPSLARLEGLRRHHGLSSVRGITFCVSAQCMPERGRRLTFIAGDACHGARMLYDIADGSWLYARAVIMAIYTLPGEDDSGEVWMEHKFAFERSDLLERPAWAEALCQAAAGGTLGCAAVGDEELLLSAGSYHSPLALVVGNFGILYCGHGKLPTANAVRLPLFECRRGFNPTSLALVSLRHALAGLKTEH